jgi:hypothetical protein
MGIAEFASISTALNALKTISDIAKNANSIELTQKVIDLQNALLDTQREMHELQSKYLALLVEHSELKEQQQLGENLVYANSTYWTRNTSGRLEGPYLLGQRQKACAANIPG